jgi:hypothetical protein
MENVPIVDTTGAAVLEDIVERLHRDKKRLLIAGMRSKVRKVLYNLGVTQRIGIGNFLNTVDEAIRYALSLAKNEAEPTHLAHSSGRLSSCWMSSHNQGTSCSRGWQFRRARRESSRTSWNS